MTYYESHQQQRKKLWADVYAAKMAEPGMMINDAKFYADEALKRFDTDFPMPLQVSAPASPLLTDKP